jgi:hypothetical protein
MQRKTKFSQIFSFFGDFKFWDILQFFLENEGAIPVVQVQGLISRNFQDDPI